jgi:hypothetical protein
MTRKAFGNLFGLLYVGYLIMNPAYACWILSDYCTIFAFFETSAARRKLDLGIAQASFLRAMIPEAESCYLC